jgi:hypothetical protein
MRESELIRLYGLPKEELREYRLTLVKGVDWDKEKVGDKPEKLCPVKFFPSGMLKVLERFGVKEAKPAEIESTTFKAKVVRCDFPNLRLMTALAEGSSNVITVQTFDSRLFYRGAEILVTPKGAAFFCSQRPVSKQRLFSTSTKPKPDEAQE